MSDQPDKTNPAKPPQPANETSRIASLDSFRVLDSECEATFDEIAELASQICQTPIALISLVDRDRQWFKSRVGLDATETPRDVAFCAHAINFPDDILEVPDARLDARFAANPLVTSAPNIRFYAGAPLVATDGAALGTLCVIDEKARTLTAGQRSSLQVLARQAMAQLELRKRIIIQQEEAASQIELKNIDIDQRNAMLMAGIDLTGFLGLDYTFRFVNGPYLEYWQKSTSEIIGLPVARLVGTDTFDQVIKPMLDRCARGESVSYEAELDFPGKGKRYCSITYSPALNRFGDIIGIVFRTHDIDHLKRTERTLQASVQKLVDLTASQQQFIYILSHDLREPLNTISNFSTLLQTDFSGELSPPAQRFLGFISSGANRMKRLIDDLTQFVRLENTAVAWEECDLNTILAAVLADLDDTIRREAATVRAPALPVIKGRASLIRLLLQNLVANAIKFHAANTPPVVEISVQSIGAEWQIAVRDNGIGIEERHLSSLFMAFRRLNSQKEFAGTGIGLAMAKKIAEMHGGRVWVTSTRGAGSEFFAAFAKDPPQTINNHPDPLENP